MTVRFDPAAPYEVEHVRFPGARRSFIQHPGADSDTCVALMRDFIGRQLAR